MKFEETKHGVITQIQLHETRLDAAQSIRFKEAIREIVDEGAEHILLDMQEVKFMDSSGLGALVAMMKYMGAEKKFELTGLTPMVEKVFKLTRMDEVFQVHPSVQDAITAVEDALI
ncbi:STAS domain-containing protein [Amylibacter sp. SFDW26]|uniref:STAS domain-containing protein n=1 Tax=Amylibacter sp. SFDW26 TaxID=2652722 RepID=UPI0012627610|nr:STAS domain-containing protein [Amylibacter sp. SFDW26]KAB7614863.1 STAS domain-containing protein [Amylibacter sp. SFDW26]